MGKHGGALTIGGEPAHDHRHARICPCRCQEERSVFHIRMIVHVVKSGKACHPDALWDQGEEETVPNAIGDGCDEHGENERDGPRGNGV